MHMRETEPQRQYKYLWVHARPHTMLVAAPWPVQVPALLPLPVCQHQLCANASWAPAIGQACAPSYRLPLCAVCRRLPIFAADRFCCR
eukprot:scaffold170135_cov24-Tisochrysis_lutea.AAC.1